MPFSYLGDEPLLYTQYRDEATGRALYAVPGGSYDMEPAASTALAVPPADGRWAGDGPPPPPPPPPAGGGKAVASGDEAGSPPPAAVIASPGAEDEGK